MNNYKIHEINKHKDLSDNVNDKNNSLNDLIDNW